MSITEFEKELEGLEIPTANLSVNRTLLKSVLFERRVESNIKDKEHRSSPFVFAPPIFVLSFSSSLPSLTTNYTIKDFNSTSYVSSN